MKHKNQDISVKYATFTKKIREIQFNYVATKKGDQT